MIQGMRHSDYMLFRISSREKIDFKYPFPLLLLSKNLELWNSTMVKVFTMMRSYQNPSFLSIPESWNSRISWTIVKVITMKSLQNPSFRSISESWNWKNSSTIVKVFTMKSLQNPSFWCISELWNSKFSSTMVKAFAMKYHQNPLFWCISELWV